MLKVNFPNALFFSSCSPIVSDLRSHLTRTMAISCDISASSGRIGLKSGSKCSSHQALSNSFINDVWNKYFPRRPLQKQLEIVLEIVHFQRQQNFDRSKSNSETKALDETNRIKAKQIQWTERRSLRLLAWDFERNERWHNVTTVKVKKQQSTYDMARTKRRFQPSYCGHGPGQLVLSILTSSTIHLRLIQFIPIVILLQERY